MNLDFFTATMLAFAGFSLGMREIVLSPGNETFPKAPMLVRGAMFTMAMGLAAGAMLFFGSAFEPGDYAGQAARPVAVFAFILAIYDTVLVLNLLRQRYSPEVWRRLNRATETVRRSCPEIKASFPAPLHVRSRK